MTYKGALLFFSLLFTSFFCAAQRQSGCIVIDRGVAENRIYHQVIGSEYCLRLGWRVTEYSGTGRSTPLRQRSKWSPDPVQIQGNYNHCHVERGQYSHCGVEATFTQLSTPIDTNIFLLITVTGIIGYFTIYRRHRFA